MLKNILLATLLFGIPAANATSPSHQTAKFTALWNAYVKKTESSPLQSACRPILLPAQDHLANGKKVEFKGTIVLHHGFTACPQQYQEWAKKYLNPRGFDVALTVLPGHGLEWMGKENDKNDLSNLPTRKNWYSIYSKFTNEINTLMAEASGVKVIGGLSVGAEVAIGNATAAPALYDRVILFSPFLQVSTEPGSTFQNVFGFLHIDKPELIDDISNPKNIFHWISKIRQSWGKDCEKTERSLGRAGYCQFTMEHLSADQQYGESLVAKAEYLTQFPPVQVIAVEHDTVASVAKLQEWTRTVEYSTSVKPNFCFMPANTNHSLLSRFDSPAQNKYWIPSIEQNAANFVVDGIAVSTERDFCSLK